MNLLMVCVSALLAIFVATTSLCGRSEAADLPWELSLGSCGELAGATTLQKQVMCADEELRNASAALVTAYKEKAGELNPLQLDALRIDHNLWIGETCVGDRSGALPLSAATALACLRDELPKRRQFVLALPVDKPEKSYLLSHFERALLARYAGLGIGLINNMGVNSRRPEDAVRAGLRRAFAAVLPNKLTWPYLSGSPVSQFVQVAFGDDALRLEAGRFFIDFGAMPHSGSQQGAFIVDMETGELSLAMIDASSSSPMLAIWEKACVSSSLRDFSRARFRIFAAKAMELFLDHNRPKVDMSEDIGSTPCQ